MYNGLFKEITPISAYWFGYLVTDGCMSDHNKKYRISLSQKDEIILKQFSIDLGFNGKYIYIGKNGCGQFQNGDKDLCQHLLSLGLIPRKSRILDKDIIPKIYQNHFIRGCLDGDGTVCLPHTKGRKVIKTLFAIYGHKPFLEGLQEILLNHNIKTGLTLNRISTLVYSISSANRTNFNKMRNFLYNDANRFLLRKKMKFDEGYKYNLEIEDLIKKNRMASRKYDIYIDGRPYIKKICIICGIEFQCRADKNGDICTTMCANSRYKKYDIYKNGRPHKKYNCLQCEKEKIVRNDRFLKIGYFCNQKCKTLYKGD